MTRFVDAMKHETEKLYLVEWWPEDFTLEIKNPARSYVVAQSFDDAGKQLSSNPSDIKMITYLGGLTDRRFERESEEAAT